MSALLRQLGAVIETLEEDRKTQAAALATALRSGTTVYALVAALNILNLLDKFNQFCQKRDTTVSEALTAAKTVLHEPESERENRWKDVHCVPTTAVPNRRPSPGILPRRRATPHPARCWHDPGL